MFRSRVPFLGSVLGAFLAISASAQAATIYYYGWSQGFYWIFNSTLPASFSDGSVYQGYIAPTLTDRVHFGWASSYLGGSNGSEYRTIEGTTLYLGDCLVNLYQEGPHLKPAADVSVEYCAFRDQSWTLNTGSNVTPGQFRNLSTNQGGLPTAEAFRVGTPTFGSNTVGPRSGIAELTVLGGGQISTNGYSKLGFSFGDSGSMYLNGQPAAEPSWLSSNWIDIGYGGYGRLELHGGATVTSQAGATIAAQASGQGVVIVDASTLNVASNLGVGERNSGSLSVSNGGVVNAGNINIGNIASGNGTATFSNARGFVSNYVDVGTYGTGAMSLQNGSHVTASPGFTIGWQAGGTGSVSVNSSQLDVFGSLYAGHSGKGDLEAKSGSIITSSWCGIGVRPSGVGSATIDSSSQLSTTTWLGVGGYDNTPGGKGTLTVSGVVNVGQLLRCWPGSAATITGSGKVNIGTGAGASQSGIHIWPSGTLNSTGVINGNVYLRGGTISPNGPGTANIIGSLSETAGTTKIYIKGSSVYTTADPIVVSGAALLGGTLELNLTGAPRIGWSLDLIRASSITGKFAAVINGSRWKLVYEPTKVRAIYISNVETGGDR